MTKPIFGKWTRVEDGLPEFETQAGGIEFVFVLAQYKDGRVSEMEYNSQEGWRDCGYTLNTDSVTHWMPLPKEGQDAFTELRAKLEDLENRYDKEVSAWSFDEILNEIREVIE